MSISYFFNFVFEIKLNVEFKTYVLLQIYKKKALHRSAKVYILYSQCKTVLPYKSSGKNSFYFAWLKNNFLSKK